MTEAPKKTEPLPDGAPQIQTFDNTVKKKKKPTTKKTAHSDESKQPEAKDKPAPVDGKEDKKVPDPSTPKDYTYQFLLDRITNVLLNKSKDASSKKKVTLKPPEVQRLTGKRCAWVNFDVRR